MPLVKLNWPQPNSRLVHWLSPLLIFSLGIHGLAMMIPIREKEDIVEEPEIEIPAAIQISELPTVPTPASKLPSDPTSSTPEGAIAPEPINANPAPAPPPVHSAPTPTPTPEPNPTPASNPTPTPNPTPNPTPHSQFSSPQKYQPGDNRSSQIASFKFLAKWAKYGGVPEEINTPLILNYPAAGKCYEEGPTVNATVFVAVSSNGNVYTEADSTAIAVTETSGYEDIDQWIEHVAVSGLPADAFHSLPNLSERIITDWIHEVHTGPQGKPLIPVDTDYKLYAFKVQITIQDSQCASPS